MRSIIRFAARATTGASASQPPHGTVPADTRLVGTLDNELWDIAIHTAVLASYLNYLDTFEGWHGRSELLRRMPSDPMVLTEVGRQLAEIAGQPDAVRCFHLFEKHLEHAKHLLRRLIDAKDAVVGLQQRGELVGVWQAVADSLLICLYERDRLIDRLAWTICDRELNPLGELLIAVRDGGMPLLRNGIPCLPSWALRRRHRRIPLNALGTLHVAGRRHAVRILDVSQGGLGLAFVDNMTVGAVVAVTMDTGRRLLGRVAWVANGRAGLEFAAPLAASDPLLSSG